MLISITTFMHIYVFWRIDSVPFIRKHVPRKIFIGVGVILWAVFLLGRVIGHDGTGVLAKTLEFLGMNWMAVLFLTFIPLLLIDTVTIFGLFMPRLSSSLRGWGLIVGVGLSVIALIQGLRPPVITEYEVNLPGLPKTMDRTVLVALSDMHLGSLLGKDWLTARIAQVKAQQPDIVVLLGDIFEGHGPPEDHLVAAFKQLSAPLGIWAVSGNHEFHRKDKASLLERVGFRLLSNEWTEVSPGLVLSGVDDLTTWHRNGQEGDPISQALAGRPASATIFLSHTPWKAERISKAGVGLMLSGHTHGGQIWPFDYLVRNRYPLLEGRYEVDGMAVIVCRGMGTWGPRMRLWRPSEILRVTLRAKGEKNTFE
jgi:predicted MPP superfamily phosphohydrolase